MDQAEKERAVLAGLILAPHLLDEEELAPPRAEAFSDPRNQKIYVAYASLRLEVGAEIGFEALLGRLKLLGWLEDVGGFAYVAGLDLDLPDLVFWRELWREMATSR